MKYNHYNSWEEKLSGLRKLAISASTDVEFRNKIYKLAKELGFTNLTINAEDFLDKLFKKYFIYVDDPNGQEFYHEPKYFLDAMLGDCDDAALLTASICVLLSVPFEFILVKVGDEIKHIYTRAYIKGKEINFDFTLKNQRLNIEEINER